MNNYAPWRKQDLSSYALWTHTITHQEWLNVAVAWAEAGGTVLETATVSETGALQCHILDHGQCIHAVYTLSDVPLLERGVQP